MSETIGPEGPEMPVTPELRPDMGPEPISVSGHPGQLWPNGITIETIETLLTSGDATNVMLRLSGGEIGNFHVRQDAEGQWVAVYTTMGLHKGVDGALAVTPDEPIVINSAYSAQAPDAGSVLEVISYHRDKIQEEDLPDSSIDEEFKAGAGITPK